MDPIVAALVAHVVVPGAVAIVSAFGAWLLTIIPGPLKNWLSSGTHQRDMDVASYARTNLPDTIAKLAPDEATLRTMAAAIVAEAAAKLAPKVVPVPIDNG
jgi:DNA-directed RNA polymerase specialized sigma24 family protein